MMYDGTSVAVVVPAYNEEAHVGSVLESVPDWVDRIYAVDDCSTDGTWGEIRRVARTLNDRDPGISIPVAERRDSRRPLRAGAGADDGAVSNGMESEVSNGMERLVRDGGLERRVVPIRHERNQGVGGAMKTGYRRARADGFDVAASMDGDGQMDPAFLPDLIDPIVRGEARYTKGDRLRRQDSQREMSHWRLFGNTVLTALTRVSSGYWGLTDSQNGYTAISLDVFEEVDLEALYDDYGFLNDLLVHLNVHGVRIADVPMPARYGDESSGIRYRRFVPRLSWLLLWNFLWRLWTQYVVQGPRPVGGLFALGGAAAITGGGLFMALVVGLAGVRSGTAFALFAIGVVLVLVGLAVDVARNDGQVLKLEDPDVGVADP